MITGVSGSGKSSLAFDTLYAEGQRRYAESLSTYARQFLERLDRPDVDSIEPVPPAIALEQKNGVRNARSTVGTQTEIYRLAAASLRARRHDVLSRLRPRRRCREAWTGPSRRSSRPEAGARVDARRASAWQRGRRVRAVPHDAAREEQHPRRGAEARRLLPRALAGAARRVEIARGRRGPASDAEGGLPGRRRALRRSARSRARRSPRRRTRPSRWRGRSSAVFEERDADRSAADSTARAAARTSAIPRRRSSRSTRRSGACAACQGFGRVIGVDLEKVIPDRELTLSDRPVAPWNTPAYESAYRRPLPRLPPLLGPHRHPGARGCRRTSARC